MYNSEFAVCSDNYDGKDFFNMIFKYITDPYFEQLTFEEKFVIKIYMDYYRSKSKDERLKSSKIVDETTKTGTHYFKMQRVPLRMRNN